MSFWLQNASQPRRLRDGPQGPAELAEPQTKMLGNGRAGSAPQAGSLCFLAEGRMDKLINVCLLHLALFLDMQTLPSLKACGVGMSRPDKQGVAPPQACSLARWPLLTARTCARALQGDPPDRAGPPRVLRQATRSSPGAWGDCCSSGPPAQSRGGGQASRTVASTFLPIRPLPRPASPNKF